MTKCALQVNSSYLYHNNKPASQTPKQVRRASANRMKMLKVKVSELTDEEIECLEGGKYVLCSYTKKEREKYYCFDCLFPNGDTHVLRHEQVY